MSGPLSPIVAAIFSFLLCIVFFSKKRIKLFENDIFGIMLICVLFDSFIVGILQTLAIIFGNSISLSLLNILNKLDFIFLIIYANCIFIYTLLITYPSIKSKIKGIIFTGLIFDVFSYFLIIITKINILNDGFKYSISGVPVMIMLITCGMYVFLSVLITLFNINSISKKHIPILSIVFLIAILIILFRINPYLVIISITLTLVNYIMYFTIQNPDVRMIEQLEIAKESADKANRAKTDFLSSMSHEIRTPLNAISGFSECIMNANTLDEAKENAKDIIDASGTLIEIVNGILDVSKIEAGKMDIISSPYNSFDVFSEPAKLITPRMKEKGLDFNYYIAPDIPKTLYGDHANIKKIVTNLLSNACKYTNDGFVKYEVNCVNSNNYTKLIISVEDSGRGIKKQNIDKMFTKFQRLEEDRNTTIEGTGLGLAITKQLTELMGGKIIVHSIYGRGSKFTVIINQKISDKEVKEEHEYKTTLNLENVKILLVDDTLLNLKVAKKILEGYNANLITTCESGFECLDIIKKGEKFDIILLDDMMPKMSGVTTLKKLKEIPGFNIPTVALTANAITGMKESYLAEGFTDYLAKPIEKDELVRVINQILGRVATEKIPVITEDIEKENSDEEIDEDEQNRNDIIPVEDNIEELLGDKLDLSDKVDTHFDNALAHVDHIHDDVEVLDDVQGIKTIPVVDIDIPTETFEKVDINYLKDNGVDIDHALELLGDMDMYNSTVSDFLSEIDDKWNRIVEYKNNSDMENYAVEVHSLKSDSKYLGLMKLADIAYQHELKSKENDIEYVNKHFNELEDEFNISINVIRKYDNSLKMG